MTDQGIGADLTLRLKPAEALAGVTLDNGWTVLEQLPRGNDATGGSFSVAYVVAKGTERAFLKALDFTIVGGMGLPLADALKVVTDAYVFERDLVMQCAGRRMTNVVRGLDAGEVQPDHSTIDPQYAILSSVPYIIFEVADGDVRAALARTDRTFTAAWAFRILHGVANGLRQLHQAGITHQDLKPSNVMTFGSAAKVGDLGRASTGDGGLFDAPGIPGDRTYAPPELLYREFHADDRVRRQAADMFHLGSLAIFLFTGSGLTALIESNLDPSFHWRTWPRDYRNVLPYVRDAYDQVMTLVAPTVPPKVQPLFERFLRETTDPDPLVRGNPKRSGRGRYEMEMYVSLLDRLAIQAEIELRSNLGG